MCRLLFLDFPLALDVALRNGKTIHEKALVMWDSHSWETWITIILSHTFLFNCTYLVLKTVRKYQVLKRHIAGQHKVFHTQCKELTH